MKQSMSDRMSDSNRCKVRLVLRPGFTLIEMLVSAALTVLIMSLFAQIFAMATGSIQDQRTIARHDQKIRVVEKLLRNDLMAMSFRQIRGAEDLARGIIPLHPDYPVDEQRQRGYWEYSENNPTNKRDDILQFTVDLEFNRTSGTNPSDGVPLKFTGRAAAIGASGAPDQPVDDDGNGAGGIYQSRAAEVSYFLRGGNLFRRVLMLRDTPNDDVRRGQPSLGGFGQAGPVMNTSNPLDDGLAPGSVPGNYTLGLDNTPVDTDGDTVADSSNYYEDFDLAATRYSFDPENDGTGDGDADMTTADTSALFIHTIDSLSNVGSERPLGQPWNRFGHYPLSPFDVTVPGGVTFVPAPGQPFEFLRASDGTPSAGAFIGRFTHADTSFSQFNWPGLSLGIASPFNSVDLGVNASTGLLGNTVTSTPFVGARVGEDLIMSNVHAFDVKVWDDFAQQFVDLGSPAGSLYGAGSVALTKNQTAGAFGIAYGPLYNGTAATRTSTVANNNFDTWHHAVDGMATVDVNGNGTLQAFERNVFDGVLDQPPVWASQSAALIATDGTGNTNGVAGAGEIAAGARNTNVEFEGVWDTNNSYQIGDIVIPDLSFRPYSNLTIAGEAAIGSTAFRLIGGTDGDSNGELLTVPVAAGGIQPNWYEAIQCGRVVEFGVDDDPANPATTNDTLIWAPISKDDRVGLKKIAITLTVRDPKSDTLRDVTLVHSFVE